MYVVPLWSHVKGLALLKRRLIGSPLAYMIKTKVVLCLEHRSAMKRIKRWANYSVGTFDLALEADMPGPPEVYLGTVRDGTPIQSFEEWQSRYEAAQAQDDEDKDRVPEPVVIGLWDCRDPLEILIEREDRAESLIAEFTHTNREKSKSSNHLVFADSSQFARN